ncbi:MAG TPA: gamma-glutamylcyclotransferase family protein [Flavihumibacter sp.]|jgi:gamma-glutamylcyclotransferase (GGCT)/AIG2-like uncharacterized protein YtfP
MLLFVYGTLRKGFQHPAFTYISENFEYVSEATVKGRLFDLGEYPAAIPAESGYAIRGELYRLKADAEWNWAIAQLDDYEGLFPEEGETPLYNRSEAPVELPEGTTDKAWVYWYNGDTAGYPEILSGDFLQYHRLRG